jgi:esterase/lipase superfamily enzyme
VTDDIDLQWLAMGNALIQPLYKAKVAADLKLRPDWARVFNMIRVRFTTVVQSFAALVPQGIARDHLQAGLDEVETADLIETVRLVLYRGDAGIVDLFETSLSAQEVLLAEIDADALPQNLRREIITAITLVRRTIRDKMTTLEADINVAGRTKFNLHLPATDSKRISKTGEVFDIWFGTNRKPVLEGGKLRGFSAERDNEVHVGRCAVEIPVAHRIGSTGSSWWRRLLRGDDRLRLAETLKQNKDEFWSEVQRRLAAIQPGPADIVVFVHGYNTSFEEAAISAAQIGADLSLPSLMAFFSWPSRGKLFGYLADEATIEASEPAMVEFLNEVCARSGARTVHLVAHSMGNRGLLRAAQRIAQTVATQSPRPFGQIILAAPDVDTGTFQNSAGAYGSIAERTTLYVSAGDRAVLSSRILHAANRVGFSPPVCIFDGIDTINVTNVDMTQLGHGYVASSREVLIDMFNILMSGLPPERRATLRRIVGDGNRHYWEFAR